MSAENVEVVRRGYADFVETGDVSEEFVGPGFVWDMSTFGNWPERQTYEGVEGARQFLADWTGAWEDWSLELKELLDTDGDEVVAILRQSGRSKATGLEVDMDFAQVWTVEDGKETYMRMYSDPDEALRAFGLS
jgi:ketosteroid isomerase-like protein